MEIRSIIQIRPWSNQFFFKSALYGIAFTLPLVKPHWNSKIILVLGLITILTFGFKAIWAEMKANKVIWLFTSLIVADLIGILYTENLTQGFKFLETQAPILLFPIIIFSAKSLISSKTIENLILALSCGILVTFIGYIILIFMNYNPEGFSANQFFQSRLTDYPIIRDQTTIDMHPSFLSLYISFCLYFFFGKLYQGRVSYIYIFLSFLFFIFLTWLNSRAGIIGFFIVGFLFSFVILKRWQKIFSLIAAFTLAALLLLIPFTRERFIDAPLKAFNLGMTVDATDQQSWALSFRIQITDCSLSLLENYRWLYGYGTGDFRDQMYKCYAEKNYTWLSVRNFDQHCEFFAQIHRVGILGLILFIAVLAWPMTVSIHKKNYLYLAFLLLIAISAVPENILSSQKGVVFYSLFNSILFLRAKDSI